MREYPRYRSTRHLDSTREWLPSLSPLVILKNRRTSGINTIAEGYNSELLRYFQKWYSFVCGDFYNVLKPVRLNTYCNFTRGLPGRTVFLILKQVSVLTLHCRSRSFWSPS